MNTKTQILTLILFIGFVFPNCDVADDLNCSCPDIDGEFFDVQGVKLTHHETKNNTITTPIIDQDSIGFADYHGILMEYQVEYHSNNSRNQDWNFSLMPSALACSCIDNGWEGSKTEKLENLTIITQNDFNTEYLAGDTLNNLFEARNPFLTNDRVDLNELLVQDTMNLLSEVLWLHLKEAPQTDEDFQVTVIVELSENEVYQIESSPIKITN